MGESGAGLALRKGSSMLSRQLDAPFGLAHGRWRASILILSGLLIASGADAQSYCIKGDVGSPAALLDANVKTSPVSRSRYLAKAERRFRKYDRDGNGMLVQAELPTNRFGSKALKRFDANRNGTIAHAEWVTGVMARFNKRDVNNDGILSVDETGARYDGRLAPGRLPAARAGTAAESASNDDGED